MLAQDVQKSNPGSSSSGKHEEGGKAWEAPQEWPLSSHSPAAHLSHCFRSCSQISRISSVFTCCRCGPMDPEVSSRMHTLLSRMAPNSRRLPAPDGRGQERSEQDVSSWVTSFTVSLKCKVLQCLRPTCPLLHGRSVPQSRATQWSGLWEIKVYLWFPVLTCTCSTTFQGLSFLSFAGK